MYTTGMAPAKTVYVAQFYSGRNFACETSLFVGRYKKAGDVYRSLLQFPFYRNTGQLSPKSVINSAYLKLNLIRNDNRRGWITLSIHQVWQSWSENTVTWINQPLFSVSPEACLEVKAGRLGLIELDITSLAREWHQGRLVNYGLLLSGDEDRSRLLAFSGRKAGGQGQQPFLEIEYQRSNNLLKGLLARR